MLLHALEGRFRLRHLERSGKKVRGNIRHPAMRGGGRNLHHCQQHQIAASQHSQYAQNSRLDLHLSKHWVTLPPVLSRPEAEILLSFNCISSVAWDRTLADNRLCRGPWDSWDNLPDGQHFHAVVRSCFADIADGA